MIASGATSDNEWYNERQWLTTNDNEWPLMATSDSKWQRVTMNNNEWQRVVILTNFPFFRREEPTTMHPKETIYTFKRVLKRDYWGKNRSNKPLRKNINCKKQVSRKFSCFWYIQLETFPKIVEVNLVGYSNSDKCSYETPHEYLSGLGNHSGRIILIKRNH